MPYTLMPDVVTYANNLITLIANGVNALATARSVPNWLPASSIGITTPLDPYPQGAPKPFGVLRVPTHSSATKESQTLGNIIGKPNMYTLYVYFTSYVASTTRVAEETQFLDTYSAIATALVPPDGSVVCMPDSVDVILSVSLRQNPNGPFIQFGGATWIGGAIDVAIDQWYN